MITSRSLHWGLNGAALWIAVSIMGCAATSAEEVASEARSSATDTDLTGANLDKRKFLLGTGTYVLGRSVAEDIELLRKLTGHTFQPTEERDKFPNGERQLSSTAPLFKYSPMFINGTYWYRVPVGGTYHSAYSIAFNTKNVCITVQDLEEVLGVPTRVVRRDEVRGKGLGPSDVWQVFYDTPSGGRSIFAFTTAICANDLSHSSIRNLGRKE